MRVEKYPAGHSFRDRFPSRRMVAGVEGGAVDFAEEGGHYYVIFDEAMMGELLDGDEDKDIIDRLISVYVFDSEAEREQFVKERGRGWYWLKPRIT